MPSDASLPATRSPTDRPASRSPSPPSRTRSPSRPCGTKASVRPSTSRSTWSPNTSSACSHRSPAKGSEMPFTTIENAIAAIARGDAVVVVDDASRENEGDLIIAAEKMRPEMMGFMVRHTSGVICMPLEGARLDHPQLPMMVADNTTAYRTACTVSVDAKKGTTTGISAADRAATVNALIDDQTRPDDLARPGHIFPL